MLCDSIFEMKSSKGVEGQLTERKAGKPALDWTMDRDRPLCALAGLTGFWRQKVRERDLSLVTSWYTCRGL